LRLTFIFIDNLRFIIKVNFSVGSESDVDAHTVILVVAYWQSTFSYSSKIAAVIVPPDIEIA
jgi:hypothetical protein